MRKLGKMGLDWSVSVLLGVVVVVVAAAAFSFACPFLPCKLANSQQSGSVHLSTLYSGCFHVRKMLIREWLIREWCCAVLFVCTYTFVAFSGWRLECLLPISQYGYGIVILHKVRPGTRKECR